MIPPSLLWLCPLLFLALPVGAQSTPQQEPLVQMVNRVYHAVVNIDTNRGAGSGFFVDAEGHVVTNAHVIAGLLTRITVLTQDGQSLRAQIIGKDEEVDLAVLKVEGKTPFTFISLEKLSPNMLGQTMVVMGNPRGVGTSVSRGVLSGRGRALKTDERDYGNLLQTDAAINPGNSGGPILDLAGDLSGVTQLRYAGAVGLNYAIPAETVRAKVKEFLAKAK
jgi:serine protease Do